MTTPRLLINLQKVGHNARLLVRQLAERGISVTGVTKAALGCDAIARVMIEAGVQAIGESRVRNIESLHGAVGQTPIWMQRAPMLGEASTVVSLASLSFVSELETIAALSAAADRLDCVHHVLLMVEMGDLREGIMPGEVLGFIRQMDRFERILLGGIGTNLACRSGIVPDTQNMLALSELADHIEQKLGIKLAIVSGGNSANLGWALGAVEPGRINNLRLGEAMLLGREPAHGQPLPGLHTDAFALVAEVIESKAKPRQPWGSRGLTPFETSRLLPDDVVQEPARGSRMQSILAVGRQDINPADLIAPLGMELLGASSDHLIIDAGSERLPIGCELTFGLNYAGLLAAMTSPFVMQEFVVQEIA